MSLTQFKRYFPKHRPLAPTDVVLRDFSKNVFAPVGKTIVQVTYNNQTKYLPLYIVDGERDKIFGRELLRSIKVNWADINQTAETAIRSVVHKDPLVEQLLQEYKGLFEQKIGLFNRG